VAHAEQHTSAHLAFGTPVCDRRGGSDRHAFAHRARAESAIRPGAGRTSDVGFGNLEGNLADIPRFEGQLRGMMTWRAI